MSRARRLALFAIVAGVCSPASPASGAGAPVPTVQSGRVGVIAPGGDERFTTRRGGHEDTILSVARRGSTVRTRRIPGRWGIPAATVTGGTTGLSGDGSTLVLARVTRSFPPQRTRLLVVNADTLRPKLEIPLSGFFTVDAVSPDGRWAYLIQYASDNPLDYRVRALDTVAGRLAAKDVVDPRKPDEKMGGMPYTRATSADGRWAYTLYGGGSETFIHALDTVGRSAACIDLDMLPPQSDLTFVRLRIRGDRVLVRERGELIATMDRTSFAVHEPGAPEEAAAPPRRPAPAPDDGFPWPAVLIAAAGLCAAGVVAARLLSRPPAAGSPPRA
jgi:hypothetical protein